MNLLLTKEPLRTGGAPERAIKNRHAGPGKEVPHLWRFASPLMTLGGVFGHPPARTPSSFNNAIWITPCDARSNSPFGVRHN